MKLLSNITLNQSTRSTSSLFLSSFWTYWLPFHSLLWPRLPFLLLNADFLLWLRLRFLFLLLRNDFLLWLWLCLLFLLLRNIKTENLHHLKYREFSLINWLEIHQNEYPKTSFLNFLKYGENKESHMFTIDNTNVI